jgi:hypothetical protein
MPAYLFRKIVLRFIYQPNIFVIADFRRYFFYKYFQSLFLNFYNYLILEY